VSLLYRIVSYRIVSYHNCKRLVIIAYLNALGRFGLRPDAQIRFGFRPNFGLKLCFKAVILVLDWF